MQVITFGTGQAYGKFGLQGLTGSGKTFSACGFALYIHRTFGIKTPIALFDTEAAGEYVDSQVFAGTGMHMVGGKSRSMMDLMDLGKQCVAGLSGILLVDSLTHVWREVCEAYLAQVNKGRLADRKSPRQKLEFQDWANIKEVWNKNWTDFYLNSPLHIIICGRGGFEYAFEENEDTGKKELVKTGTKMKVENEFGFEPSLLIEMERLQVSDENRPGRFRIVHRATVIKDRFNEMTGTSTEEPAGDWIAPFVRRLTPGAVNTVDTQAKTPFVTENGDGEWMRERKLRTILCEKLHGELGKAFPSQTKEDKAARVTALEACFGTFSKTEIESMPSDRLRVGLAALAAKLNVPMIDPEAQSLDFGPAIEPKGE